MIVGAGVLGFSRGGCVLDALSSGVPAAAYGLRRLTASYKGKCVNVRRSSDNTAMDVGFVGNRLDTVTLLTFVGAGSGYITSVYNQGGLGNSANLSNYSASGQPCIVSAGALVTLNGIPAMDFSLNSGAILLNTPAAVLPVGAGPVTTNVVAAWKASTANGLFWMGSSGTNAAIQIYVEDVSPYMIAPSGPASMTGGATVVDVPFISTVEFGSTGLNYLDGALVGSGSATLALVPGAGHLGYLQGSNPWGGFIQEFIVAGTALTTADRQTLEHNQESYYGITGI